MATKVNIIRENTVVNFGDKVWSTNDNFNGGWPWGLVGILSDVTFNGNTGGVDVFSNYGSEDFDCNTDYRMAITVGSNGADAKEGHLVINGGVYKSLGSHCVYVMNGVCEINGGVFFTQPSSDTKTLAGAEAEKYGDYRNYLLNLWDTNGKNGKAKLIVRGGSFVGFDPADNYAEPILEGRHTNFVAVGYKSVLNGTWTYRVKDVNSKYHNQIVEVPVYTVVPLSDEREGIEGTVVDE